MVSAIGACSSDEPPIDCEKSGLVINLDQIIHATSCSTNDGSYTSFQLAEARALKVFLNDQLIESTDQIDNLTAGVIQFQLGTQIIVRFRWIILSILADDFSFISTIQPNTSAHPEMVL